MEGSQHSESTDSTTGAGIMTTTDALFWVNSGALSPKATN